MGFEHRQSSNSALYAFNTCSMYPFGYWAMFSFILVLTFSNSSLKSR